VPSVVVTVKARRADRAASLGCFFAAAAARPPHLGIDFYIVMPGRLVAHRWASPARYSCCCRRRRLLCSSTRLSGASTLRSSSKSTDSIFNQPSAARGDGPGTCWGSVQRTRLSSVMPDDCYLQRLILIWRRSHTDFRCPNPLQRLLAALHLVITSAKRKFRQIGLCRITSWRCENNFTKEYSLSSTFYIRFWIELTKLYEQ